jgi:ABC-type transport system substrate-binding protein
MEIVQQMFKRIGVTVKPAASDFGGIMKRLFGKSFNMASWIIPGVDEMGPTTKVTFHSKSPFNLSGYTNETVDDLLVKQSMSLDGEERMEALCGVARQVNDDVPFVYLFGRKYNLFSSKKIRNVPPPRNEYIRLSDVWIEE